MSNGTDNVPEKNNVNEDHPEVQESLEDIEDDETLELPPEGSHYRLEITGTRLNGEEETESLGLTDYKHDHGYTHWNGSEAVMWMSISCLSLLSLAGLRLHFDPQRKQTFMEPPCTWEELAFERLPEVLCIASYNNVVWGTFKKIEVKLIDWWEGKTLRQLRLLPPAVHEAELEQIQQEEKFSAIEIPDVEPEPGDLIDPEYTLTIEVEGEMGIQACSFDFVGGGYEHWVFERGKHPDFDRVLPILNLLSLAGAVVYQDHDRGIVMFDPKGDLETLLFAKLPHAASNRLNALFFWRGIKSITVTLKFYQSSGFCNRLRMLPPEDRDA